LVIAVLFGGDQINPAKQQENSAKGLSDLLDPKEPEAAPTSQDDASVEAMAKQLEASKELIQQPLIAKPQRDREIVERANGPSRTDHMVRWVTVKTGDGYERLVRRWCGEEGFDDYVAEAKSLNEDKPTLIAGIKIMVPLVSDEKLVKLIEDRAPRAVHVIDSSRTLGSGQGSSSTAGWPAPSATVLDMPGGNRPSSTASGVVAAGSGRKPSVGRAAAVSPVGQIYKVKPKDNLWTIAAKIYGKGYADQMVLEMKELNPGLTDRIQIGQKIKLPAKGE
jgi:hypothetical protein